MSALKFFAVIVLGCGRIGFDPVPPPAQATLHAYVLDGLLPLIHILDVAADGSLALATSDPFMLGAGGVDLAADARGAHLYVTETDATIHAFAIAHDSGALTEVDSQQVGTQPQVVTIHPSGQWLYVSQWQQPAVVYGFAIAGDGTLQAMPGSPFAHAGLDSSFIAVHPSGRWLYTSSDDHNVYGYSVSASDGTLTAVPAIQWPSNDSGPWCVLIEPSGNFGWVAPDTSGGVPGFTIDQADGTLTTTPGSKFGSHGNTTEDATLDRTGSIALFANQGDGSFTVTAYAIDSATGALVDLPGSPFPTPSFTALTVAASPVDDDVYFGVAGSAGNSIARFRANLSGIELIDQLVLAQPPGRLAVVESQ